MLVLSRRVDDRICLFTPAGKVTIAVKSIGGNRVALGIEAPAEVRILRGELSFRPEEPACGNSDTPREAA